MLLQFIINGIIAGSLYSIAALGYTLIYGIARRINFAQGEIYMFGSFCYFAFAVERSVHPIFSCILAILLSAIIGLLIERFAYRPLQNASRLAPLISTIGVSIFLQGFISFLYGPNSKTLRRGDVEVGFDFFSATITKTQIVIIFLCIVLMFGLHLLLHLTKFGKAIRTTSEDREIAITVGINTTRIIQAVFAISAALAAAAGIMVGFDGTIEPTMGTVIGFKGFTAAVLGGMGNIIGAVLGGFIIGITENLGAGYISSEYKDTVAFIILIIMLLLRPRGILGKKAFRL